MKFKEHTKEEALQLITELVETFRRNEKTYKSLAYDEANTRTDFIDKFFEALNWDVRNDNARAERYRDVVREDKIQINGQTKAPDYSFRVGGNRVFFVEAKKPSVNIKEDVDPAFQLRRYAYTAKLPISILTDFEEFAVYETNKLPRTNDKASDYRIKFITYDKYIENFDFLWNTFSLDAVMNGNFDRYCEGKNGKRGTSEIDSKLLETIEDWRIKLAKNIALRNPDLSLRNLNSAVQKIIDRIVFLRIAEDKDIEEMETLLNASKKEKAYAALRQVFDRANEKYNSGLFANEKWLDNLVIDDKVLSDIISELYYPKCPYAWVVLPVEILGNIYEKFLGSEITFRNVKGGHTAQVEQKPEVKKAGGVYYTPRYIVEYIVKQTVARKLEGKTPNNIKKLTICDPACGSGSFLVGAYKYLMDWYLAKYSENDEALTKAKKQGNVVETSNGLSLSLTEKQRILTTHIYGVDIDAQAVEVTKLSLFLQMLEGEGKQYVNSSMLLFRESDLHILPNLGDNIKCGNSLVGSDFYINQELNLFDEDAIYKINAFDWNKQFPQIFKDGGFECVIGNPPYFNIQTLGAKSKQAQYIQHKYSDIWQDKSDILFYFINKAFAISRDSIGYIVSNAFLFSDKAQKLRNKILDDGRLKHIVNFEQFLVFDAGITTCVAIFEKGKKSFTANVLKKKEYTVNEVVERMNNSANSFEVKLKYNDVFALIGPKTEKLNKKIDGKHPKLSSICKIGKGMETAADKVFLFDSFPTEFPVEFVKKRVTGENMDRYIIFDDDIYVLYYEDVDNFDKLPESIKAYLSNNKIILSKRATCKNEGRVWWRYSRPMHKEYYNLPKLYCNRRDCGNNFCYDDGFDYLGFSNMTVIFETNKDYKIKYILALLNSNLLSFRYKSIGKQTGGGSYEYFPNGVGKLPIPAVNDTKQQEFAKLADQMMIAVKKQHKAVSEQDKRIADTLVSAINNQINQKVYELYGITDAADIAMIEGND